MWIFAKTGFLSLTDDKNPNRLVVRARVKGDIEAFFPNAKVARTEGRDYLYRTVLPREEVAIAIANEVRAIKCGLKASVTDKRRERFYFRVWDTCWEMQQQLA